MTSEPRRRLHPLSPLLHGARSLAVVVAALSWNTLGQLGFARFALGLAALAVVVVIISVIGWLTTGYHVVGRELRIQDGVLWRRHRTIPLERLQSVELRRPLLAQLTGLAELRLEVVGGAKTEAPLAFLSVREATALRTRLLALAGRLPTDAPPPQATTPAYDELLFRVANRDLVFSQLLTPQAALLPVGGAVVIAQTVMSASWTFIGVASTVTALAGVLLQPLRRLLQDWNFRIARSPERHLLLQYGLTETHSQVVPLHRVQSVRATWPLLWRPKGWLHLQLDIAGSATPGSRDGKRSDRLLPVGDLPTARALVADVLPGVDLLGLPSYPPPPRARWRHPLALPNMGIAFTDQVFVTRWGLLRRELMLVPYARLQSVRVVQGPLQRVLRLATVYADAAGEHAGVARDRDLADAWTIAEQLTARARYARGPGRPDSA